MILLILWAAVGALFVVARPLSLIPAAIVAVLLTNSGIDNSHGEIPASTWWDGFWLNLWVVGPGVAIFWCLALAVRKASWR
jgi:hypothetical protein